MLVTFTTKAHADIIMFGEVALAMLSMMGHSSTVPGAILAADVPVALSRLSAAIEAIRSPHQSEDKDTSTTVNMAKRGGPLLDLLTAAARDDCDVLWR